MSENVKTIGIVLKSSPHVSDASRRLEIFSPELGRFSAVIRGVEKPKAKLAVCASPFCFGEFVLAEKSGHFTVTDCFVHDTFYEIAYNLDSYVLGGAMLEITSKLCQEGEQNFELFKLLLNSLKVMVYEKSEPTATLIKFIIESLKLSGFGFSLDVCSSCGKEMEGQMSAGLVYEASGVVCSSCENKIQSVHLENGEWAILKNISNTNINSLASLKFLSREKLTGVLKLALKQLFFRTNEKVDCLRKYFEE